MPDLPDLAALREALRRIPEVDCRLVSEGALTIQVLKPGKGVPVNADALLTIIREGLAVLALVDTLQGENERLREALLEFGGHAPGCHSHEQTMRLPCTCDWPETRAALSVSPAEKKQP